MGDTMFFTSESYSDLEEVRRLVTTGVQLFLYGMYIPLFGVCIHVIRQRKRGNYRLHITLTTILFILCTTTVILHLINVAQALKMEIAIGDPAVLAVYMLANVCTDLILIHRCYVIWQGGIYVIIVPVVGLCINLAFGISVLAYQSTYLVIFLIMTLVENIMLTGLTAGRIWWINREAGAMLGPVMQMKYRMIVALIMESSILYSIAIIGGVVSMFVNNALASDIALNAQTQLVGIAPTLLVVRVGLGVDVNDVGSSVKIMSMNHFGYSNTTDSTYSRIRDEEDLAIADSTEEVTEVEAAEVTPINSMTSSEAHTVVDHSVKELDFGYGGGNTK